MIGPPPYLSTCLAKRPDYTPDYRGDYRPRVFAPAVVKMFMLEGRNLNVAFADYRSARSQFRRCSQMVVTSKPAEIRHFSAPDYLTTSFDYHKRNIGNGGLESVFAGKPSPRSQAVAP